MRRRKTYRPSARRAIKSNLVSIKRKVTFTQISLNTWQSQQYAFTLAALPSYTEFTNLFEQYRINAVKLTFIPYTDSIEGNTTSANLFVPRVYTIIDKDGSPLLSSETAMQQYNDARLIRDPCKAFSIYVRKPCVQFGTANALTVVGGAPKPSPWLDCDNHSVQHWGCGIGGVVPNAAGNFNYSVVATYYMQFKNAV